ncbi:hypothetical protein NQ023_03760 [Corynebacterium phoceense]|uniref:hypothetical protein n=1 Tax=Corynebacterium phoceense TaxID=1686286 RepID=UPI00211C9FEF|nr:hypothetical protein [Corynebacterium phoceense]MCQ9331194.1 hypothetical protein [Corynebacterium phoceense]MCQ9341943.1 hypothetical protein [Corynebacterium phoceense]MCQ9344904.1 hypothetical protein [Corynebacterium phoceense]MCQ9347592.1 hypothetical protein [Corynebacterium phoceense]
MAASLVACSKDEADENAATDAPASATESTKEKRSASASSTSQAPTSGAAEATDAAKESGSARRGGTGSSGDAEDSESSQGGSHAAAPHSPTATMEMPAGLDAQGVGAALAAGQEALANPSEALPARASEALGADALEEAENQRTEYESNGWRQEGTGEVVEAVALAPADEGAPDGTTRVVRACVDNSGVRTFDADGTDITPNLPASERRSITLLTFERVDGQWKLMKTSFPDDPRC